MRPFLDSAPLSPAVPTSLLPYSAGATITRSPPSCLKPIPSLPEDPSRAPRPQPAPQPGSTGNTPGLPISAGARAHPRGLARAPLSSLLCAPLPPLLSSQSSLAAFPPVLELLPGQFYCRSSHSPPLLHEQAEGSWEGTGSDGKEVQAFLTSRYSGAGAKEPSYLYPVPSTVSGWPRSPPPPLLSTGTTPHPSILHSTYCTVVWPETACIPILAMHLMVVWHQESHLTSLNFQFFTCKMR